MVTGRTDISADFAIRGPLIAKNALLNIVVQSVTVAVALFAIPVITRLLGPARFGLITIVWVLVSYVGVFDLGLGRAVTKFAAGALGAQDKTSVRAIVRTAVQGQFIFGLVGATLLFALAPVLGQQILRVPESLAREAQLTLRLLALGIPVILISGSMRGILEATQRFDLVNAIRLPGSLSIFLIPAAGAVLGLGLPAIVGGLLAFRAILLVCMVLMLGRLIPVSPTGHPKGERLRDLIVFGGWVTVSSIIDPILGYMDRFVIARLGTLAAVGYYAAPFEIVTRIWILPIGLTGTLFPAFSTMVQRHEMDRLQSAVAAAVKYLILAVGVLAVLLIAYGSTFLGVWLGQDFARQSGPVIQILAIGAFLNSLAYIPTAMIHALGRPDLTAKFHIIELPMHMLLLWIFVGAWGIIGAAIAWSVRVTVDAVLLFVAATRLGAVSPRRMLIENVSGVWMFLAVLAIMLGISAVLAAPLWIHGLRIALVLVGSGAYIWRLLFDDADRRRVGSVLQVVRVLKGTTG